MALRTLYVVLALSAVTLEAAKVQRESVEAKNFANPIRKVVQMLQMMQEKVTKEGEKEKELYSKFMCYCKNSGGALGESIAAAEAKSPVVSSDISTSEGRKATVEGELAKAKADREAAKAAMAEATSIREKEAAAFASEKSDLNTNIAAINKAIAALEKGMAGGFLQTADAKILQKVAVAKDDMLESERQMLLAFLSGTESAAYVPRSGEITGILKQLGDTMSASRMEATATEEAAIKAYEGLMAAKKKEVTALGDAIEAKSVEIGELAVKIVELKNDLSETQASLAEDKKFLEELEKGCATKTADWEARSKTRADELAALAETIKVLNDDDALELFKKTLSAGASFVEVKVSSNALRSRALAFVNSLRRTAGPSKARLDLIALALRGKSGDFSKVLAMIDDMAALLKKEQVDDDTKKEYCLTEFDTSDDTKKATELKLADEASAIASAEESIATLKEEIANLEAAIAALDKAVAEATEQRKEESADFKELMASDSAAKELLGFAKNRLYKFYEPKLYKAPAKTELSAEDRVVVSIGGAAPPTMAPGGIANTGISMFAQVSSDGGIETGVAPPPPPETYGAYATKGEENTGVIAMIDLLIKDLDKEMTEAKTEEADAQADYEVMMKDSTEKRILDSKTLTSKQGAKADTEAALAKHKKNHGVATKELAATLEYIGALHTDCDWLIKYFDTRKEARNGEISSLANAKAVLSGADYSLLQAGQARGFRRRFA